MFMSQREGGREGEERERRRERRIVPEQKR
jgi:hypothetical protein